MLAAPMSWGGSSESAWALGAQLLREGGFVEDLPVFNGGLVFDAKQLKGGEVDVVARRPEARPRARAVCL